MGDALVTKVTVPHESGVSRLESARDDRNVPPSTANAGSPLSGIRSLSAFESRTEQWRQVGLGAEVDRAQAQRARGGALIFLALIAGVLVLFSQRQTLFPGLGTPVRIATVVLLVVLGWGLARLAWHKASHRPLWRRLEPGTAGVVGFTIRLGTIMAMLVVALRIAGLDHRHARRRWCLHRRDPRSRRSADNRQRLRRDGPAHHPPVPRRRARADHRRLGRRDISRGSSARWASST